MKMSRQYVTLWLITLSLICVTLQACSSYSQQQTRIDNPGDYLLTKLRLIPDIRLETIEEKLIEEKGNSRLNNEVQEALEAYRQLSAEIFLYKLSGLDTEDALISSSESHPNSSEALIYLALTLFPSEQANLVEDLLLGEQFSEASIQEAILLAKLDPIVGFPPTATEDMEVKIQPLFHSASITLFKRQQNDTAKVQYRETGDEQWQDALELQWEPIRSALSGSVIKLKADTRYEFKILLSEDGSDGTETTYALKTQSNSPPINPDLVYRLSDIYTGGQLDLEVLNIQGEADGWAKIIGDENTPIIASEGDWSAINIGDNSYVMFENITVQGGDRHGIKAEKAHHIWINGCNISKFGRTPSYFDKGIGYENAGDSKPINYDAGITMYYVGSVVIENCEIHSPNGQANHWGSGHPQGPSAMLVLAKHPDKEFEGQYVIRNNRFYGSEEKRFNDIIESRSNGRVFGGFLRDSAIYDNYFAYANDDIIELDGGQSNVLVYNNELEQGYVGISAIPNMLGPNYIFNNYIHNLGDQRGGAWSAIKLGGLITAPAGKTLILENLVENKVANGIAASRFKGDYTYWAYARNNIFLALGSAGSFGYGIWDRNKYSESDFINNFIYNRKLQEGKVDANITQAFSSINLNEVDYAEQIISSPENYHLLPKSGSPIPNFSTLSEDGRTIVGIVKERHKSSEQTTVSEGEDAAIETEIRKETSKHADRISVSDRFQDKTR